MSDCMLEAYWPKLYYPYQANLSYSAGQFNLFAADIYTL